MSLSRFGFIVTGAGLQPGLHCSVLCSPQFEMFTVGVSNPADGPAAARMLLNEGVQLIELCGGFGPLGTASVLAEVDGAVPVGSVAYGPESIDAMHRLFAD
ncbi:MAG: DUF6506 family protein [Pseudomonadota bacterium]